MAGEEVLFASKNNKAVDVETRVNNLGSHQILLRMGSKQYQTRLAEYLISLLTPTSTEHDLEDFNFENKRYKLLEDMLIQLDHLESELIRLRNETDELDQIIENIRLDLSANGLEYLTKVDLNYLRNIIIPFKMP